VGQPVYRVTNLNDSGAGSLRDAVSQGNRCVVFDLGGTINLSSELFVIGANTTIDGFTAPSPGITVRNYSVVMHGNNGASNIIIRGIRSRDAFQIAGGNPSFGFIAIAGVSNIVLDHCSIQGYGKDGFAVTDSVHDVTIQWCIVVDGAPNNPVTCPTCSSKSGIVKYDTTRVSVHHNLFFAGDARHPHVGWSDVLTTNPSEVVADVRNNLIWGYTWVGTEVRAYGNANIVNNYYYSQFLPSNPDAALYIREGGNAYASGNYSPTGLNIDAMGTQAAPFAAIVPTTTDAITAARQIVAQAGARGSNFGLDAIDLARITQISLP
jgi:pectate lyase